MSACSAFDHRRDPAARRRALPLYRTQAPGRASSADRPYGSDRRPPGEHGPRRPPGGRRPSTTPKAERTGRTDTDERWLTLPRPELTFQPRDADAGDHDDP